LKTRPFALALLCFVALCLLLSSESVSAFSWILEAPDQSFPSQGAYPAASWALGVVAPEGAEMAGGGSLHWEDARNVTALVVLPSIEAPDLPVYAVLSLMTQDESVLQVAAGIEANGTSWSTYADFDTNVGSISPSYQQILNASQPEMSQGASISLSIFQSASGAWSLKVEDSQTGASVTQAFPGGATRELRAGDQEAFALESYSRNQTTFENMGNLTLRALLIDGEAVAGGLYSYGDWIPNRNPLFVVGSLGASPPLFVSVALGGESAVWSYLAQWGGNGLSYSPTTETTLVLPLAAALLVVAAIGLLLTRMNSRITRTGTVQRSDYPNPGDASWDRALWVGGDSGHLPKP